MKLFLINEQIFLNSPPIPSALTMNSGLETSVLSPIAELFFFVAEELLREDKVEWDISQHEKQSSYKKSMLSVFLRGHAQWSKPMESEEQ